MTAAATIRVSQTVDDCAAVGEVVVLEACNQVREAHGERAALEVAGGALSAAVATILLTLGESTASNVVATAIEAGVQAITDQARKAAH